jgi:hypothetical protein
MPPVEDQIRSYAEWLQREWPDRSDIGVSELDVGRTRSPRRSLAALAALVVVALVVALAVRDDDPGDRTDEVETTETTPPPTTVPAEAPRYTNGPCVESRTDSDPVLPPVANFPGVAVPDGLTLVSAHRTCLVLGEQLISDHWQSGTNDHDSAVRVLLHRIEKQSPSSGENEGEPMEVNGKPAILTRIETSLQVSWDQDVNGVGAVVTEGIDEATTLAIAESFDRVVADTGPRVPLRELTRDEAVERARYITSTLTPPVELIGAKRMTWADLTSTIAVTPSRQVAGSTVVWVVAGTGSSLPVDGAGEPVDTWGVVVFDALTVDTIAFVTGGVSDGGGSPTFFDELPDRP